MNKKTIAIIFIMTLLIIGFSGCVNNTDDEKFLNKADIIIEDIYPINEDKIINIYSKLDSYKFEISDYTLSSDIETVRDRLYSIFENIELCKEVYLGEGAYAYLSYEDNLETLDEMFVLVNTRLESAIEFIELKSG
jgi:hypothetical protein